MPGSGSGGLPFGHARERGHGPIVAAGGSAADGRLAVDAGTDAEPFVIDATDDRTVEAEALAAHLRAAAVDSTYARRVKPVLDAVLTGVLLVAMAPAIALIALAVLIDLGSPVFFVQPRIGRDGRPFQMLKFRTMRPDRRRQQRSLDGPDRRRTHKDPCDPRLTRVGRFLRTWSLDELPQLVNVLLGHMSLVGPRPEMVTIVERYQPWQHLRHIVKPGVTGLWQVSGRGEEPMHERTDIDLEYLRCIGLWTDLRILARTVPSALGCRRGC